MSFGAVAGLILAAGAGRRMGRPKALMQDKSGEFWLERSIATLADAGCEPVTVVLGAAADEARRLLPQCLTSQCSISQGVEVVVAEDWASGQSASLRAGLAALAESDAVVVSLVDLPDVTEAVVRRVLSAGVTAATLSRAVYDGRPGHPVVLGRDHWADVAAAATGDEGARGYLRSHGVVRIECGDLASGADQDHHG